MTQPLDSILSDAYATLDRLRGELLADRGSASHWTGTLSASALSTATAVSALAIVARTQTADRHNSETRSEPSLRVLIERGVDYLIAIQNSDGGFGDTDRSHSNVATTMLAIAALRLSQQEAPGTIERAEEYVDRSGGVAGLRRRYGKDKTFVIPILTNCALAGMVPWHQVQALPFEAAAVPQSLYRRVRMPVVSYAIPALVAIGQAHFFHAPPRSPALRLLRRSLIDRTMRVLERMQPESGGYLEATPLTSFVLMSLASTGRAEHPVSQQAIRFLRHSALEDGSWPIDTNLATWVTSLAIHALASDPRDDRSWADDALLEWLLSCQHARRHPFTGAEPGGWGWTDLSGAVPDGDDTPAALLALRKFLDRDDLDDQTRQRIHEAGDAGAAWLLQLQNRDGGWPTFCRGWGRLPFDRSSTDLTAHAIRALRGGDGHPTASRSPAGHSPAGHSPAGHSPAGHSPAGRANWELRERAIERGHRFLRANQQADGSWLPLWFGNQDHPEETSPAYGTGRVLLGFQATSGADGEAARRGADFLVRSQNPDGGWGGGTSLTVWLRENRETDGAGDELIAAAADGLATGAAPEQVTSSIEETAVALEGLSALLLRGGLGRPGATGESTAGGETGYRLAIIRAVRYLCDAVRQDRHYGPWPIGFYFAKLWYHERLYPTIFVAGALGAAVRALRHFPAEMIAARRTGSLAASSAAPLSSPRK